MFNPIGNYFDILITDINHSHPVLAKLYPTPTTIFYSLLTLVPEQNRQTIAVSFPILTSRPSY